MWKTLCFLPETMVVFMPKYYIPLVLMIGFHSDGGRFRREDGIFSSRGSVKYISKAFFRENCKNTFS